MIIVKNRKMVVPYDDMYIGTTYDDDSERRIFRIDRYAQNERDLSALTFRLDIKQPGQQADTVILDRDIDERYIYLIWNITNSVIRAAGLMFVQIRAIDSEATVKWSTYDAALYVARHLDTPGSYTGSLTEIEQMEQDFEYMKGVVEELKSHLDYTHEAEAWAIGKKDGEDVPSTDETYHNNSKYYSEQAGASATAAANSATAAAGSATQAAATVADTNTRFDNAVAAVTVNTEVQDARVGADGTTYTVLKNRLDAEHTDVKTALNALASDNAITGSVNAVQHSAAYAERLLKDMTFIGGNTYILSLKFDTAGWGYCYLRVTGSDLTTRYFNQGIDTADQPGCKFLFKPDVDIYNASVVVIRPAATVDTITVSVECIDPSLYDLVVNDWQENLYVDYDATVGRLMTTGAIEVTDINRTSDFIPVSGKDYLTYQIWNPIPEGDATKNWTAICFYDSSKNLVGARRTTNIAAQEHEVVTIKVPETAMFARVAFLFRSLDYKCMITYGVYTPAYRKSRTDIIHDAESYTLAFDPDTFYNGTLYPEGNPTPNDKRIYSDQFYHVNAGDRLLLDNTGQNNPVKYVIYFYNDNQEYQFATLWSSARVYKFESSGYVRFVLSFANEITIQLSDIAQMVACVKLKRSVQDQIDSMEGKIRSIETQDDFEHDDKYRLFSSLVNGSGKSEGFVFFTDPHLFPEGEVENMYKRFATYTDEIASSYYKTATSFCVCGGDWLTGNASKDNALYKLNLVTAHMKELFRDKFYNVYGNHDDNAIGGGPGLTTQEVVNVLFPYSENAYYTFKEKYGRFYVFDSGTDQSPDMNAYRWTQIDWFAHQLIENDDPYSAVLLHIVWNINSDASIAPLALNINTIIGAYNSHTTVTANGITYDFTGCTGKVYFILGGHGHIDKSDTTTYNVPVVIRKNTQPAEDRYATAYDLVYVDWTGGKLYFVRIGYGASTSAEAFDI